MSDASNGDSPLGIDHKETVTFQPPQMHRWGGGLPDRQWGDIFTPLVPDPDEERWRADNPDEPTTVPPAALFQTEADAMECWNLTAEGLRSVFGPPIPAGVVWPEPVWPVNQMQHIYDEYVRPVFKRLHLDPEADVKEFFYATKEQQAPSTEKERQEERRKREWLESPDGQHWQARADQRRVALMPELQRGSTAHED